MVIRRRTCALAVAALLCASCHNGDDSFSQAAHHAHSTLLPSSKVSTPQTTTAAAREVSLRPRELRFDEDTKPCDLLQPSQITLLGGDSRTPTPADADPEWRSRTCYFGGPTRTWSVTTVTDSGVEGRDDWPKLHRQMQVGYADPIAVAFPAYTAVDPARVTLSCYLAIDTADKQMLVIGIELNKPTDKRTPCAAARPIAEAVMRTLIT